MSNAVSVSPAVTGLRMVQAMFLFSITVALVLTMIFAGAFIPPVAVFALIYALLGGAVLRWRGNTKLSIAAAVLAVLGLVANAPFLVEDLAHPESWGSFIPASMSVIAGVGSVAAAVLAMRGAGVSAVRPLVTVVEGVTVAAITLSLVLGLTASSDEVEPGDVVVLAEAVKYPESVTMSAGPGGIAIDNQDLIRHTFVIEDQDVKVEVPAGTTRRVEVDLVAGEYHYICDVPGHEQMEGTLTVQ